MSIARCLAALALAAVLGGCASVVGTVRSAGRAAQVVAEDEVALLRLAEKVEAASLEHDSMELGR